MQDDVAAARIRLGYLAAERKDYEAARSTFLDTAREYGGKGEIGEDFGSLADQARYQAIVCLVAQGKVRDARREFRAFLKDHPLSLLCQAAHRRLARLNGGASDPGDDRLLDDAVRLQSAFVKRETALCGPKVLAMLLKEETGKPIDFHHVARQAGADEHGASMDGLRRAARSHGLELYGYLLSGRDVQRLERPAILLQGDHYVLLRSARSGNAVVADTLRRSDITIPIPTDPAVQWVVLTPELLLDLEQPSTTSKAP